MQKIHYRALSTRLTSIVLFSLPLLAEAAYGQSVGDQNVDLAVPNLSGNVPGELRSDNDLKLNLVWCPPGTFTMGSPPSDPERGSDETQVSVRLSSGFWLGQTEITQGQWKQVMRTEPWKGRPLVWEDVNYAASYLSWEDASAFCKAFTASERRAGRLTSDWQYALPTEAQWEYACRAGTTTQYWFGDDASSRQGDYAWWGGVYGGRNASNKKYAQQVGVTPANAWGLHDTHGNMREWCQDEYHAELLGGIDPLRPISKANSLRVLRSGSWPTSPTWLCRSAARRRGEPHYRGFTAGFRLALVPLARTSRGQERSQPGSSSVEKPRIMGDSLSELAPIQ